MMGYLCLLLLLSHLIWPATVADVIISLLNTTITVHEGDHFEVDLHKSGTITEELNAILTILKGNDDFLGSNQVAQFTPNGSDEVTVIFFTKDDTIPEDKETFKLQLSVPGRDLVVGTPNTATITILPNDDIYGAFSFISHSPVVVQEEKASLALNLQIRRNGGTVGQITLFYEVNGNETDAVSGVDVTPVAGTLVFADGVNVVPLILQIEADDIPEDDENFSITLVNASRDARINMSSLVVIVQANDAPVYFDGVTYRVEERKGGYIVPLRIKRGFNVKTGKRVGSVTHPASVKYILLSRTAVYQQDFSGSNETVIFSSNETEKTIQVSIIDDLLPEIEEYFEVLLTDLSGDIILGQHIVAKVVIAGSDNPNGLLSVKSSDLLAWPRIQVDEDEQRTAIFMVIRNAGMLGNVSVEWNLVSNNTGLITNDVSPTHSLVVFRDGEREKAVVLTIVQDNLPEPAEQFIFQLLSHTVKGGAKVEGVQSGILVIEDSDKVYGVVGFGDDKSQKIITTSSLRVIELVLVRTQGSAGTVRVDISVTHNETKNISDILVSDGKLTAVFTPNETSKVIHVPILPSAFLQVGRNFYVIIENVMLLDVPELGAYNSPTISSQHSLIIAVTAGMANGEVGFKNTTTITVDEPNVERFQLSIRVTREGTSGQATVNWLLTPAGSSLDIYPSSGSVMLAAGISEIDILVAVLPDDLPEVNETFNLTLVSVQPAGSHRLKTFMKQVLIVIKENDNPGGTFQFSPSLRDWYEMEEGGPAVNLVVERFGGALLTRNVQYHIEGGTSEFYGATNTLRFEPGMRSRTATILAIDDNIPEVSENFTLKLIGAGAEPAILGSRTSLNITINQNDQPHGVIQFSADCAIIYLNESTLWKKEKVSIIAIRLQGLFGTVKVKWKLKPEGTVDLSPVSGTMVFSPQQAKSIIEISSTDDRISEGTENFTVELVSTEGGALLGNQTTVMLIIRPNDFPVFFQEPHSIDTREPSNVSMTLLRQDNGNHPVTAWYRTIDGTAVHDNDYVRVQLGEVQFTKGMMSQEISVQIVDDSVPEGPEYFLVEIFKVEGDAVSAKNNAINITIRANDNANGVFGFAPPLIRNVSEGETIFFSILRYQGTFGKVEVEWEIQDNETKTKLNDGSEYITTSGSVVFEPGEVNKTIALSVINDNEPELVKTAKLRLSKATVHHATGQAALSQISSKVFINILTNDYPYGLLAFVSGTLHQQIAEDFSIGEETKTKANFIVQRKMGKYGSVKALWEIFPNVTIADQFPRPLDLTFVGVLPDQMIYQSRPGAGTPSIFCSREKSSRIRVSAEYQPQKVIIKQGFTVSAWVYPFAGTNGYILAKTSDSGARVFYALKLITTKSSTVILFQYTLPGELGNKNVTANIQSNSQDEKWHLIQVTIGQSNIKIYLDLVLVAEKNTSFPNIDDGPGVLFLCAKNSSSAYQFTGRLQDVRIYNGSLREIERRYIFENPVAKDVQPMSGVLTYKVGDTDIRNFSVHSIQDELVEGDETFFIRFISSKGGVSVSRTEGSAKLTVLKSDGAGGIFGFQGACEPISAPENSTISCRIERTVGFFDSVIVNWTVVQVTATGEQSAAADVQNSASSVRFESGEKRRLIDIKLTDDDKPELEELFHVKLVGVMSTDGSTNTSGARVDTKRNVNNFTIRASDQPFGILQFSNVSSPPSADDPIIPIASEIPQVHVDEEIGVVQLLVVRAQGSIGQVTCEWRTEAGTAKPTDDFLGSASTLTFVQGQRYTYINVTIIDDKKSEAENMFEVKLYKREDGIGIGAASSIRVIIKPSDNAFGRFQFANLSLAVSVPENSKNNVVQLEVIRTGGSIGASTVTWKVQDPNAGNDLHTIEGTLEFDDGVKQKNLTVQVLNDTEPELNETFLIQLVNVSSGNLGDPQKLIANLTVMANDDPFGIFTIPENYRPVMVKEGSNVTVAIQRSAGHFGVVEVKYYAMASSEKNNHLPNSLRASIDDFQLIQSSLRFSVGQKTATFIVKILDDNLPEVDESVFVRLRSAKLVTSGQTDLVYPRFGADSETYACVIIEDNDYANGILNLNTLSVTIPENKTGTIVSIVRTRGTFGQIKVKFQTVEKEAKRGYDFAHQETVVNMLENETIKAIPIIIIDDRVPESSETFEIELTEVVEGGAILGNTTKATITIEPSDDPNGKFEFATSSTSVEEPNMGQTKFVNITVIRQGGTSGVVIVSWKAIFNGSQTAQDVQPKLGSVQFVSKETRRQMSIEILPDDHPEIQEDVMITLLSATNGGKLSNRNTHKLSILPNDNPRGTVQFSQPSYMVSEETGTAPVSISRIGGTFGKLKVSYSTKSLTFLDEVKLQNQTLLTYFNGPTSQTRSAVEEMVTVAGKKNYSQVCANVCLKVEACVAFMVVVPAQSCMWYRNNSAGDLKPAADSLYYVKKLDESSKLYTVQATPGEDYKHIQLGTTIIENGASTGYINVSIFSDNFPELAEKFLVQLEVVQLLDGHPVNSNDEPKLGSRRQATIVISKNDNAHGVFFLYSNSPLAAAGNRQLIAVEEIDHLAVELVVERQGGTIGQVSVSWIVNTSLSSATKGNDYVSDGATIKFSPGEKRKVLTISVQNDQIPENNETIVVQLTDPSNGSILSKNDSVTVVVMENDNVAGKLAFNTTSLVAKEGDTLTVVVIRTMPAKGTVTVDWKIQSLKNLNSAQDFTAHNGSLLFAPNETKKTFQLTIKADSISEISEEYQLNLFNVKTQGVGATGAAAIISQFSSASITIEASDEPHGIISFAPTSLHLRIKEDTVNASLQIIRKFGTIGTVRVFYSVQRGSVAPLSNVFVEATPGDDFVAASAYTDLGPGVTQSSLAVQVLNDEEPEVEETFLVMLTNVSLIAPKGLTIPPQLDLNASTSQVIIEANDGTKGVVQFALNSSLISTEETDKNITLTVVRERGIFGEVSVFFYAENLGDGAIPNTDYKISPKELIFESGESEKQITLVIFDDSEPEDNERLQIILVNPRNDLQLGNRTKAMITILANDNASGIVEFEDSSIIVLAEQGEDNSVSSTAGLQLKRGPGTFRMVNVPFEILNGSGQVTTQLSHGRGLFTFKDREGSAFFEVTVNDDNVPEVRENFTIKLKQPDNDALLGATSVLTIVVLESDSPYGLLQIFENKTRKSSLSVEETSGVLYFVVQRSQGILGSVTVEVTTQAGSATASPDLLSVILCPLQIIPAGNVQGWQTYYAGDILHLVMLVEPTLGASKQQPNVFRWQGTFLPMQTIPTKDATSSVNFNIGNSQYLAMGFTGLQGAVSVFSVLNNGTLNIVQRLLTAGTRDVEFFKHGGSSHLVLVSYVNNNRSSMKVDIHRWDNKTKQFLITPFQSLVTQGAAAAKVFSINSNLYLAVANLFDFTTQLYAAKSAIYKMGSDNLFSFHQNVSTTGAVDVDYMLASSDPILVFANSQKNSSSNQETSYAYLWNATMQRFVLAQEVVTSRAQAIVTFQDMTDSSWYVGFANSAGSSTLFKWDTQEKKMAMVWKGPSLSVIYPFTIQQPSSNLTLIATSEVFREHASTIFQMSKLRDSDYAPRMTTMKFNPGQTELVTSVCVLNNNIAEDTETFYMILQNPTGGAKIGPARKVSVSILSNDNAHGVIGFSDDSLERQFSELPGKDNVVHLNLVRHLGQFGQVLIGWRLSGEHDGIKDIVPLDGQVTFEDGKKTASIKLTIKDDNIPELAEVSYVTLFQVEQSKENSVSNEPGLGSNRRSKVIVLANDSPHGVVSWEKTNLITTEPNGTDATVELRIFREQGKVGDIMVSYMTSRAVLLQPEQQAVSGEDYVATQRTVLMKTNEILASVSVAIKQDDIPEDAESFMVNLTSVHLVGSIPVAGSEPSVKQPGNAATITIRENDNAKGTVQFNAKINLEGRLDIDELYAANNTLALPLKRTGSSFGTLSVKWLAEPREASTLDFYPSTGVVYMTSGQQNFSILITILDDQIPEAMEMFTVKLIPDSVSEGGTIGDMRSVRVAILKNDSPNGLFSFAAVQKTVREAMNFNDSLGKVDFDIIRSQGSDGIVNIRWRLSADAVNDFMPPFSGSVRFKDGEIKKVISLMTKPDRIIEGVEEFFVSLIAADNNADLSPVQGDAKVIILPDPDAAGTVSIVPEYQTVYIGEPGESSQTYNGQTTVLLQRGPGIYTDVEVMWRVSPRDQFSFQQQEGSVKFTNLQDKVSVILEAINDTKPEKRTVYTFQLTAATNGSTLSSKTGALTSDIVFVASDYPHGLFEFDDPLKISVSEDSNQLLVPVIRKYGRVGQVRIQYTTLSGTASSHEDYVAMSQTLMFEEGTERTSIQVTIVADSIPEGPETFYINLTSVELLLPKNNYSIINGLSLDMKPSVGYNNQKTITIEKNDNAEGLVEFDSSAVAFSVSEDKGTALIPLVRKMGSYGEVSVQYLSQNLTAEAGTDYNLPDGHVIFGDGVTSVFLNVTIIDDKLMEPAEQFKIYLTRTMGGALLGHVNESTVTISKSDYPNGKFGFVAPLTLSVPNPNKEAWQVFTMERTRGLLGQQTVFWRILGPNNPLKTLQKVNDISFKGSRGEVTDGALYWNDKESGQKNINITIKPYTAWEIRKDFVLQIYKVDGSPDSVGNGEISPSKGNITLTILKHGDPNGIVRFDQKSLEERSVEEPLGPTETTLDFNVFRHPKTGVEGNIKVFWKIDGPVSLIPDLDSMGGFVLIRDQEHVAVLSVKVLPDTEPELTETFVLKLTRVEGGAEIDKENYTTTKFRVRYNDDPHGVFRLLPAAQTITVSDNLSRKILLNISRTAGTFGAVLITFSVSYDKPNTGIEVAKSFGIVTFKNGEKYKTKLVPIEGNGFLEVNTTFTAILIGATYLERMVSILPRIDPKLMKTKIYVPAVAANSVVGFKDTLVNVDLETSRATFTINRRGTYGSLEVYWASSGFPEFPQGFQEGAVSPQSGQLVMLHGVAASQFSVHVPQTVVSGSARLDPFKKLSQVDPSGVVMFDSKNKSIVISETKKSVSLKVLRLYGCKDKIKLQYKTQPGTAKADKDYKSVSMQFLNMDPGQTSADINIQITPDNIPEKAETFYVNLTSVTKFSTQVEPNSHLTPRLHPQHNFMQVNIKESNDPYGIFSLDPAFTAIEEQNKTVPISIKRSGGLFGLVSVTVRTIGGGELWTSEVVPQPNKNNNTISHLLGNIANTSMATSGLDYRVLNQVVTFQGNEAKKTVLVTLQDDNIAEANETLVLYLTQPTGGARVAGELPNDGLRGFSMITILRNGLSNGIIGFTDDSKIKSINEDESTTITLTLSRLQAFYGEVKVSWMAKQSENSKIDNDYALLTPQLERIAGEVTCPAHQALCSFAVTLKDDQEPEESMSFVVILIGVGNNAILNNNSLIATINVQSSDFVRGLFRFKPSSETMNVGINTKTVQLEVERIKGQGYNVSVEYLVKEMSNDLTIGGIKVNAAVNGVDFNETKGLVKFKPNQTVTRFIKVILVPSDAVDKYPKQLYVHLRNPKNGSSIDRKFSKATIRISSKEQLPLWKILSEQQQQPKNDSNLLQTLDSLNKVVSSQKLGPTEVSLVNYIMASLTGEGLKRVFSEKVTSSSSNILCKLMDPARVDSMIGNSGLSTAVENLAFSLVMGQNCSNTLPPSLTSISCAYLKISAGRWPQNQLEGYTYKAQHADKFNVPKKIPLAAPDKNQQCRDFHIIEYSSDLWFSHEERLLSRKVMAFGVNGQEPGYTEHPVVFMIHTPATQIASTRAKCAYYDFILKKWIDANICRVMNNLNQGLDDFVECSCNHFSNYAVISRPFEHGESGYSTVFYICTIISIVCLAVAIFSHHFCSMSPMFSASLLMHMCLSVMTFQICYVIAAFLSPDKLLVYSLFDSNYKCIVMSLFMHYFFLAQFSWMMIQAINFWKVLVMNDEHTDRKYILFFCFGWGLPLFIVIIFYLVTYYVYKYIYHLPHQFIYGNVNNHGQMCFITNPFAMLGGIIFPVAIFLFVVGIVFVKAFQVRTQWQSYDDVYKGHYNLNEVRTMLGFWAVITVTYLWGGIHMVYLQLWQLILYCACVLLQGLMVLVLYSLLRNPCLSFETQKDTYKLDADSRNFSSLAGNASVKNSQSSLLNESWEHGSSLSTISGQLRVKRTRPQDEDMYANPVMYRDPPLFGQSESSEFDDLMFALKVGAHFTPSMSSSGGSQDDNLSDQSIMKTPLHIRRISIPDTHL